MYPPVCIVVSGWHLSLQQPQEKQLLEQPQGQHDAGRSAGFQPRRVWNGRASVSCRYHIMEPSGASCPHHEGLCCIFKFVLIFCRENAADLQKRGISTVFYIPEGTVADGIWTQRSTSNTPNSRVSDEFDDSGSQGYAMPFLTKPSCHAVTHPCMNLCHRSWMKLINRMTELPPSWDSELQRCLSDMPTVRGTQTQYVACLGKRKTPGLKLSVSACWRGPVLNLQFDSYCSWLIVWQMNVWLCFAVVLCYRPPWLMLM